MVINYVVYKNFKRPFQQGFRYNDQSLNKPFVWPLTISFWTLLLVTALGPMFVLFVCESLWPEVNRQESATLKYKFGWTCCCILVNFVKNQVGRLRPHFLAANSLKFDATDSTHHSDYIPVDTSVRGKILAKETRHAFFSGHAMLGMYSAAYLIIYLQEKMVTRNLYIHSVQFGLFMAGLYPGITQGRNYWHHWSDVITGQLVGLVAAYLVNYHVL